MIEILNILESLEATTKRLEKESILDSNRSNDLLRDILIVSLDPYTNFGVSKFNKPKQFQDHCNELQIITEFVYELLPKLAKRELTGNLAKNAVTSIFQRMSKPLAKWCERILLRNLRCGVQFKTFDKTWPNIIKPFEVQLADVLDTHCVEESIFLDEIIKFPVLVEPKLDGLRCITIKHNGEVTQYTRNGTLLETMPKITTFIANRDDLQEIVIDAEAMAADWNDSASVIMSRVNKKDDSNVFLNVFDCMTYDEWMTKTCHLTQTKRREKLLLLFGNENKESPIRPTDVCECNSFEEIIAFYKLCLEAGYEGVMIKDPNGLYTFDRSKVRKKLKPEATYEGVIVGTYDGNVGSKREGLFGGFIVLLPNGITTEVGSGMSDDFKAEVELNRDSYLGKIIEAKGQPPLTVDGKIRFPRFLRWRDASDVDPKVMEAYETWKESH
jgi:DNA ligase-1